MCEGGDSKATPYEDLERDDDRYWADKADEAEVNRHMKEALERAAENKADNAGNFRQN